jgi:hypothetical protein
MKLYPALIGAFGVAMFVWFSVGPFQQFLLGRAPGADTAAVLKTSVTVRIPAKSSGTVSVASSTQASAISLAVLACDRTPAQQSCTFVFANKREVGTCEPQSGTTTLLCVPKLGR